MSNLNVTANPINPLELAKDGATAHAKDTDTDKTIENLPLVNLGKIQDKSTQPSQTKLNDLNYAIDHEDKALHLKIKNVDGEVVREMVFDRIDPSLLDPSKLKGIFIDGNS